VIRSHDPYIQSHKSVMIPLDHAASALQRAFVRSSSSWELASCKLDRDKFVYFKFGTCKVLNLNSI
jgi:hypothetical protein